MRTHHLGALSSRRRNERTAARRPARAPLGVVLALLLSVGGLIAVAAPSTATTAPPQGWSVAELPLPSDAGTNPAVYTATTVSPSPNQSVTVGWYNDTGAHPWGLIEIDNGTTITGIQAPQPSNAGSGTQQSLELGSEFCGIETPCQAVYCWNILNCVAVGDYENNVGVREPLLETETNGTWTVQTAPLPADANASSRGSLLSIACASTTSCEAVGQYENSAAGDVGLIETYDGTAWSAQGAPAPSGGNSATQFLGHVACSSPTACVAVGFGGSSAVSTGAVIDTLSGTTWTAMFAPLPGAAGSSNVFSQAYRVSCPAAGSCVAVGQYGDAGGFAGFIDTSSANTWTSIKAPVPADAAGGANESAILTGLSCASTVSCVTTGQYRDTNGRTQGLIDADPSNTWTTTRAPQPSDGAAPAGQNVNVQSVSCPSPIFCMAVGTYLTSAAVSAGLVETFSGGQWTALAAPLPSNFTPSATPSSAYARVVACYSAVSCAVGGWYPDPGNQQGFLDSWTGLQGYWLVASDGGIFTYGNALFEGSAGSLHLNAPVVGMASSPSRQGYWSVASDGGIFNYGDAGFFGSAGSLRLNRPVVGMAATPDGKGYWLVASDGGIFTYGDAGFFGSAGSLTLNKPVVGMAATPDGGGYWLVASDGGIFSYGDAAFFGSTGAIRLNKPVVGMAPSLTGQGYWLVASDGGIFNYGDAAFFGSAGSLVLNKPVVGMAPSPSGLGYWLVASDGGIFNYGDAGFYGSAGSLTLNKPVVGMADG